jgi:uncharacterized protein YdaU (DUF1376 family)
MKDPAFLFYTNDFDSGTKFLSNEQLGIYVRLLIAQHQHGRLTEKQFIQVAGGIDPDIREKFFRDTDGKFYNKRLEAEIDRRKAYAESRRKNVKKRYDDSTRVPTSVPTSVVRMETENETENETKILLPKGGFMADATHFSITLNPVQLGASVEYISLTKHKKVTTDFVLRLFDIFKIKEFTGKKWYNSEGDVFTHFLNHLKYEKIEDTIAAPVRSNDKKANDILSLTD